MIVLSPLVDFDFGFDREMLFKKNALMNAAFEGGKGMETLLFVSVIFIS
jgi:hypothetical protein